MAEQNSYTGSIEDPIKYFQDLFIRLDLDRRKREQAWMRWYKQWRGLFDGDPPGDTKSRLFINATKQAVVNAVSNIMAVLFQQSPPFVVAGGGENGSDEEKAKVISQVVWHFMTQTKFYAKARRYVTNCAIYGFAVGKVFMSERKTGGVQALPHVDPLTGQQKGFIRTQTLRIDPTVEFDTVDPWDFWLDPSATLNTWTHAAVFHRYYRDTAFIRQGVAQRKFRSIEDDMLDKLGGPAPSSRDTRRSAVGLDTLKRSESEVAMIEYWGHIPIETATALGIKPFEVEDLVPVIATFVGDQEGNPKHLLSAERNLLPGSIHPFIIDIWEDVGEGMGGRGVCENTGGPQTALNATINSRLDNKSIAIQQILGVNVDALEDTDDLKARANWVIRVKGNPKEALFQLGVQDVTQRAYEEAREFERFIDESAGLPKAAQGTESYGSNRTAQGIATVFQAATKFIRDITDSLEQNLIAHTARLFYQHAILFLPDQVFVMITDNPRAPEIRQVSIPQLAADVDFVTSGVQGIAMRELMVTQMIQFLQTTANPVDAQYVNRPYILKKIYGAFSPDDVDKAIIMPPPVPAGPQGPLPEAGTPQGAAPPEEGAPPAEGGEEDPRLQQLVAEALAHYGSGQGTSAQGPPDLSQPTGV